MMYDFIRRYCKFWITSPLFALAIALCQISDRTEFSSSKAQRARASDSHGTSYSDALVLGLGEPIDRVLPAGERHS
jgi:hypothetical protein